MPPANFTNGVEKNETFRREIVDQEQQGSCAEDRI